MTEDGISVDPRQLRRQVEPLCVLLVDDNEQWARFMAEKLEREAEFLQVTVALSANEAMFRLRETDAIDCVVTDYGMAEIDGLQLLEQIRAEWPELPFVLMTAEGSEDVASEAIDAGASEYLVKDPTIDQTAQFVTKITAAVEQHLLQRATEESQARYWTVIEQSRDAIMIVSDEELVFCNQRLAELLESDRATLRQTATISDIVHPEDQSAIRDRISEWQDRAGQTELPEVRLVTESGAVRHGEWAGQRITDSGEPAVLVSIRDVTERKQRERKLQWERELNRTLQTALVEARTRDELEQAVTDLLLDYGYALAWIGEVRGDTVQPWAVAGDRAYVDALAAAASESLNSEPSIWASRRSSPQFVSDFDDLFSTRWLDTAREHGYRAGAALPLTYNNVTYGVLAVYHGTEGRFDETEQQLLTELADTVAFALHTFETQSALAADRVLDVELQVLGTEYYLSDILSSVHRGESSVTVHGTVFYDDDTLLQYVTLDGIDLETFQLAAADHPAVETVSDIDEESGRLQIVVTGTTPEAELAAFGTVVRSTTVTAGQATVAVELRAREMVSEAVDTLESAFESVRVISCVEREGPTDDIPANELTAKQTAALEAAYYHGYFEQPRRSSATEVAESLDITHSTFLQHLRTAERKVFSQRFG